MKNVNIQGKIHIDRINKANDIENKYVAIRDCMKNIPEKYFNHEIQKKMINQLFLDNEFTFKKELLSDIDKKILSYKNQDKIKNKLNEYNIDSAETIEKLVSSKLSCHYCKSNVYIFYNKVRDQEQWTLDRIDNDLNHSEENVVISCLKCNLQRRCQDKEKFLFTKQLKIVKDE